MSDDLLQVARWVANGTLAPWAVEDKTVVQMARKLLEALDCVEAMHDRVNELASALAENGLRSDKLRLESVEAEREACASLVESKVHLWPTVHPPSAVAYETLAEAIRARGAK